MEHVVHPTHIPFIVESQPAAEGGLAHHRPGGGFLRNHHNLWEQLKDGFIQLL